MVLVTTFSSSGQSLVSPTEFIIGLDEFPDSLTTTERFVFFHSNKSAFRGGEGDSGIDSKYYYSPDSMGLYSFGFGKNIRATGDGSTALGENSQAIGMNSFAVSGAIASAIGAVGVGNSVANGPFSFSAGNSIANGDLSISLGTSKAEGLNSVAIGFSNISCATNSQAFGSDTRSHGFGGMVIGQYNDTLVVIQDSVDSSTPLLVIGNGFFTDTMPETFFANRALKSGEGFPQFAEGVTTRRNAFEVFYDGKSVFKPVESVSNIIVHKILDGAEERIEPLIVTDSTETGYIGTSSTPFHKVYSKEFFAGDASFYMAYSDRRIKEDIMDIENALTNIQSLRPVTYALINDSRKTKRRGFIAQELQEVFPELVQKDQNGLLSVGYQGLIPVLVAAIKDQHDIIKDIRNESNVLHKENELLMNRLSKLEALVHDHLNEDYLSKVPKTD